MSDTISSRQIVKAACPHDCPDTCALLVTVQDGVATEVKGAPEHNTTKGVLCTKVARYTERTYHAERLLYPMRRVGKKGEGKFARISWDEAISTISQRLSEIASRNPQAILPYSYAGTMGQVQGEGMSARFFNKIGASGLKRTICSAAGVAGYRYSIGKMIGTEMTQFAKAKLILIWGGNPIASSVHFWMLAQEAKRNGATLIAIDPYESLTAAKCHKHIALLPGTDSALALGIMHVLIKEDLLDHDYIEKYTLGFDQLVPRAHEWPPERVANICGISVQEIIDLAMLYGQTAKRGDAVAIRMNYGLQRTRGGGMAVRNIALLPALVGAWRHAAGGVQLSASESFSKNPQYMQRPDLRPGGIVPREINMVEIGNDLLKEASAEFGPKIEALIVYNSNPVAVAPESAKVAEGFAREDLFTVVLEQFQTDTCDYADIILPATTQLEHIDVHRSYGHTYMVANNPAIAPMGEAKPNSEIFRLMAAALGYTEECFSESDASLADNAFDKKDPRSDHYSWDSIKELGWQKIKMDLAPFARGGFSTPSGKCEFYSAKMLADGHDPLPGYNAPYESVASNPELAEKYPLAMISPPARNFLNSSFVNVKSLRDTEGEPHLEMHPDDAAARQLSDGEMVRVFNDRGSMLARLKITPRARLGLVVGLSIWWKKYASDGKNANELTSQRVSDMGEAPTFYDVLVEVEKQ